MSVICALDGEAVAEPPAGADAGREAPAVPRPLEQRELRRAGRPRRT